MKIRYNNSFVVAAVLAATALMMSSCGSGSQITRGDRYAQLYEEKPVTLLVMPPINNTSNVEAKDLLYTSISRPLAEAGYYVISPFLAMDVFQNESAYDAESFVEASLEPFKNYFGADAVVFSQIDKWAKKGIGIETKIRYFIRSTSTGDILFDRTCDLYLDLTPSTSVGNNSGWAALINLAVGAISTAVTDHIVAARKANYFVFRDIPRGKYSPDFETDKDVRAEEQEVSASVK